MEFCVEEAAPGAGNASQGVGGTPIGGSSAETRLQAGNNQQLVLVCVLAANLLRLSANHPFSQGVLSFVEAFDWRIGFL